MQQDEDCKMVGKSAENMSIAERETAKQEAAKLLLNSSFVEQGAIPASFCFAIDYASANWGRGKDKTSGVSGR